MSRFLVAVAAGENIRNVDAWLACTLRNVYREWARREAREPSSARTGVGTERGDPPASAPPPGVAIERTETAQRLLAALAWAIERLPAAEQGIERSKFFDGQSDGEIADRVASQTGVSQKTGLRRVAASHAQLAQLVARHLESAGPPSPDGTLRVLQDLHLHECSYQGRSHRSRKPRKRSLCLDHAGSREPGAEQREARSEAVAARPRSRKAARLD